MLGKTFKGLTDELLAWQTERLLALQTHREGIAVFVRPELVVEIAFDGVQTSSRYPSGMALRFARVKRYRDDKPAERGRHGRDRARDPRRLAGDRQVDQQRLVVDEAVGPGLARLDRADQRMLVLAGVAAGVLVRATSRSSRPSRR